MVRIFFALLISSLCWFFSANKAGAVELVLDQDDNLLGASGVKINNKLYDVKFEEKNLNDLFLTNGNNYNFLFTTPEDAKAASQALLDQVLVDQYDSHPEYTHGVACISYSYILTPFKAEWSNDYNDILIYFFSAYNSDKQSPTEDYAVQYSAQLASWSPTTLIPDSLVCAVWTLNPATTVPEPATALIFSVGILGIANFCRKKRTIKA